MDTISDNSISSFLQKTLPVNINVSPLAGDASTRRYFRVTEENKSFVLCVDEALAKVATREYPYFIVYDLLKEAGIPVPRIIDEDCGKGLILMEDFGDLFLEAHCRNAGRGDVHRLYRQCIDILINIQGIRGEGEVPFSLFFDRDKLNFEFNFFIEHTLRGFFGGEDETILDELQGSFDRVAGELDCPEYFVLNHRDYHSRNIMYHRGEPGIIDFQDARMGLPQYDLVSLLLDPYSILENEMVDDLKEYYRLRAAGEGICTMDREEFDYFYTVMAFQRHVKAVGSYGFLSTAAGKPQFAQYILPTLKRIDGYAGQIDIIHEPWKLLRKFFSLIEREVFK